MMRRITEAGASLSKAANGADPVSNWYMVDASP